MFLIIFLLCLLSVQSPAYAQQDIAKSDLSVKTFRVATRDGDQGNFVIFDELAKHFKFNVEYVYFDQFADVLKAVELGDADFTANTTYSIDRIKHVDVSSPTNIEYTYLYTRSKFNVKQRLKDVDSVAIAKNLIFSSVIKNNYPNIKIKEFTDYHQAKDWLNNGEVEGIVDNISKLKLFLQWGFTAQRLNNQLPIQPVAIAKTKGKNDELFSVMVKYLHQPEVQKSIYNRMEDYQYTERKKALIAQVQRLGFDKDKIVKIKIENLVQLSEYKKDKIQGIAADLLTEICNTLTLKCEIVSSKDESWSHMYQDFIDKKIDIIAPITTSNERKELVLFGVPFYTTETVLVRRTGYKVGVYRSLSEMVTEKIGVVKHDFYDQLLSKMLPAKKLYRLSSINEQLYALKNKKIDYIVIDRQLYNKMLIENKADLSTEEVHSIGVFHYSPFAFGFQKSDKGEKLAMLFNEAQTLIHIDKIISKYNKQLDWRAYLENEKAFNYKIWGAFASCFVVLFVILRFVYLQSVTDNLTKLKNRRALYQRYGKGIKPELTFVYIDVNKFKPINDTYGHSAGDAVLRQLSMRILKIWSGNAYRLGGDEFVLIAKINSERLSAAMTQLHHFEVDVNANETLKVSTSFGISQGRSEIMSIDEVMHLADMAMYEMKSMRKDK